MNARKPKGLTDVASPDEIAQMSKNGRAADLTQILKLCMMNSSQRASLRNGKIHIHSTMKVIVRAIADRFLNGVEMLFSLNI